MRTKTAKTRPMKNKKKKEKENNETKIVNVDEGARQNVPLILPLSSANRQGTSLRL